MLRALRNKSQSFLFKIFLVLIVIGFAAWGVGDLTGNKIPPVFKSNDFEIIGTSLYLKANINLNFGIRNTYSVNVVVTDTNLNQFKRIF